MRIFIVLVVYRYCKFRRK